MLWIVVDKQPFRVDYPFGFNFTTMNFDPENIKISDYDYVLPDELIAAFPLKNRSSSRLLVYKEGLVSEDIFYNLPIHINSGNTILLNNSRVIEARLLFEKPTGGVIEIFCLEPLHQEMHQALASIGTVDWLCMIGGASKWKPGVVLKKIFTLNGEAAYLEAEYMGKLTDHFHIRFRWDPARNSFASVLQAAGAIPLPPYIKRKAIKEDEISYQTVFGIDPGSVAAPTAALHFTQEVLEKLSEKKVTYSFITLHVGAGTFQPVKSTTIAAHLMHEESFTLHRETLQMIRTSTTLIATGTTSLRTLETIYWLGVKMVMGISKRQWTLSQWEAYELEKLYGSISPDQSFQALAAWMDETQTDVLHGKTSLIIVPGYIFKITSALITNFHQPRSTLLLLISAFIGEDWRKVYRYALHHRFRFLSYGDSSLLWKNGQP